MQVWRYLEASFDTQVLENSALIWILVGETEKSQSLSLMARLSEDLMPPDAKSPVAAIQKYVSDILDIYCLLIVVDYPRHIDFTPEFTSIS